LFLVLAFAESNFNFLLLVNPGGLEFRNAQAPFRTKQFHKKPFKHCRILFKKSYVLKFKVDSDSGVYIQFGLVAETMRRECSVRVHDRLEKRRAGLPQIIESFLHML